MALQLSLRYLLQPGVQSRTKMLLEHRQCYNYIWVINNFIDGNILFMVIWDHLDLDIICDNLDHK